MAIGQSIGHMTTLFAVLGGFVLGFIAARVFRMKSEDRDLKRRHVNIAGNCY